MEEEKKAKGSSNDAKSKDAKDKQSTLAIYKGEFQKIIWPSKEDLIKQTFTVVVTSLMVGAMVAVMDYTFSFAYQLFVGLFT